MLPTLFLCSFWTIFSFHALFHLKFSALQRSVCVVSLFCSFQCLKYWNQIVSSFSGCSCHRTSWERQLIFRQVSEFTMLSDSVGNPVNAFSNRLRCWSQTFETDYAGWSQALCGEDRLVRACGLGRDHWWCRTVAKATSLSPHKHATIFACGGGIGSQGTG